MAAVDVQSVLADPTWAVPLDAAIIYAPAGELVPAALRALRKGGRVVCAGIHMSDIPSFPYDILWQEREVVSVANLTRQDGLEFFPVAAQVGIHTETHAYPLEQANQALKALKELIDVANEGSVIKSQTFAPQLQLFLDVKVKVVQATSEHFVEGILVL